MRWDDLDDQGDDDLPPLPPSPGTQRFVRRLSQATPGWFARAACRGLDPRLFYPEVSETTTEAKAVCAGCPVREPCQSFALANSERYGVWGGLGALDRREALRARRTS
jgi:WhiB family transcriptional regulator, redox-sensing transcriptional regulator